MTINVLSNDTDSDGDTLSILNVTSPSHGSAVVSGTSIRYTPAANFSGTDAFSYTVSDGHGGTDTAGVTVTVTSVNHNPVAAADSATTPEGITVTINVLSNDTDSDGDTLSVSALTAPSHGNAAVSGTSIRYTPSVNYSGTDAFSYTVSDGHGGTDSANVTVTVTAVNHNPVAVNDSVKTPEDTAVTINVLSNDTDSDGDALSITGITAPAHGSATVTGTSIKYVPGNNYNGADAFTYTITDGSGGTASASVNVTVTAVNDSPVAVNDTASTKEDTAVSINVLSNDSDVDGDALAISGVTSPAHGRAVISGSNVNYTPATDYNGADTFTYTLTDSNGATASATVSVTVIGVLDPPANLHIQ